jgi:TetR/AcrR family transcriptional repressor of nem operon
VTSNTSAARPRTQPPEVRREQILDSAAQMLMAKGLATMTVADVVAGAGIAKGTFYLYFNSKQELVAALQARYTESLITRADAVLTGPGTHAERLDRFVAAMVDFHASQIRLHHALFHDVGLRDDQSMLRLAGMLATFISDGVTAGAFRVTDPQFAAAFVVHGLHGVLPPFLHRRTQGRAEFLAAATATTRQALGAGPA